MIKNITYGFDHINIFYFIIPTYIIGLTYLTSF